ncbi:hypothetical protein KR200_002797, partial [Drosophila serrata]
SIKMKWLLLTCVLVILSSQCSARQVPVKRIPQLNHHLGYVKPETRVIGGSDAAAGFAPYQVSIMNTFGEHVCGGSIIAPHYVVTAAHCLEWPIQYLKIVTGTLDYTKPGAEYLVDGAKIHCGHDKPAYHNDIALIHTAKPIVYNALTQPIRLAPKGSLPKVGDKLTLTGWGSTKTWGRYATQLQKIDLKFIAHSNCESRVRNVNWLSEGHVCTFTQEGQGSCHGDSGGPLVDENQNLVGVVNWGEACAIGYPDVFASVAYYSDWIAQMMTEAGTA